MKEGMADDQAAGSIEQIAAWLRAQAPRAAHLRIDSREIQPGDVFVALPGRRSDGRDHLLDAVARGAAAVVAERSGAPLQCPVPLLQVQSLSSRLGGLGAAFYDDATRALLTIAVTGTNGKTSCSHWIAQVLNACGRRCALIGTVGSGFPENLSVEPGLTTPDAIGLQRLARQWLDQGAHALAMEVSSIGLDQGRTDAMRFDLALFTNLTRDHLDYHGSMAEYEAAKARLFDIPSLAQAVLNLDDAAGRRLALRCRQRGLRTTGYRLAVPQAAGADADAAEADVQLIAEAVSIEADHLRFDARVHRPGQAARVFAVTAPLIGRFNVSNVLGVLGIALACGIEAPEAVRAIGRLRAPAGRMQPVSTGADAAGDPLPLVLIDYAHTPDAIAQALAALRPVAQRRGGLLWIVFGAGGDRDPGKRPLMGQAALSGADRIVLTSDNPRSEDPERIIQEVAAGMPAPASSVTCIADRARAIEHAIGEAGRADAVLIAGKGHEQYQEAAGRRVPFSDWHCARSALRRRAGLTQEPASC